MSTNTFTLLMVGAAVIVLIVLCLIYRWERDAVLGKALREAAGSESAARMAIESANLDRLLSQKFESEVDRATRRAASRLPRNVVRLVPRITSGGKPLHFDGPGAA